MNVLGLALTTLGCIGFALHDCACRRQRIQTLQELNAALELMEGELGTNNLPMPALCRSLSMQTAGAAARFFSQLTESLDRLGETSFAELWQEAAETCFQNLGRSELETLVRLGGSLGRYELTRQLGAIGACRISLEANLHAARRACPGEQKLTIGLSISAALLLLILFI